MTETIQGVSEWNALGDADLDQLAVSLRSIFDRFPISQTPNESQTEDDLIWPILEALGWSESLRQQNLSPRGREDVPDGLLFDSAETKANPNTGTAPIFRSKRDADLTTVIYGNAVPLVDRSNCTEVKAWPVKYATMFHMTNDSGLFRTRKELEEQESAYPLGGNTFGSASGNWLPLYVGRMVHQFDHRAASVEVNEANLHNAALSGAVSEEQKADPDFVPTPQYRVPESEVDLPSGIEWTIAFRDIARATDARTMIAAVIPKAGVGNTAPLILWNDEDQRADHKALLLGNLGAISLDYVTRQKAQSTHLNWYIVEQLPVILPDKFESVRFGAKSAAEVVRQAVVARQSG